MKNQTDAFLSTLLSAKTLMQRMGMEALYRRPRTTKPEPGHKIYSEARASIGRYLDFSLDGTTPDQA